MSLEVGNVAVPVCLPPDALSIRALTLAPLVPPGPDRDVGRRAIAAPRVLGSPPPTHLLFSVFLI